MMISQTMSSWSARVARRVEVADGEGQTHENRSALDHPACRAGDGARADGLGHVESLALEEAHTDAEDGGVAPDERGEHVGGLERDAAAERDACR